MSLRVQSTTDVTKFETKVWPDSHTSKVQSEVPVNPIRKVEEVKTSREGKDEISQVDVESAVESINGAIEHINRGLRFSVHEDTQQVMVKVVDVVTQEIIKEIPPEDVLDTAARIREMIGLLIDERA